MQCLAENQIKLLKAFPALQPAFHDILADRLTANNYCDERLNDAVAHVIDNCIYPTPTIAQFISFDKRMKLYTYGQVLKMNDELSGKAFEYYRPVSIGKNEFPVYSHLNDIKQYNLKLWRVEK